MKISSKKELFIARRKILSEIESLDKQFDVFYKKGLETGGIRPSELLGYVTAYKNLWSSLEQIDRDIGPKKSLEEGWRWG